MDTARPLGTASHTVVNGTFVNAEVHRVVQAIKEYEPRLDVQYIPVGQREQGVAAFKIVYDDPNHGEVTLFHVKDESEFDIRVLHKLIANDQRNGSLNLNEYEAWELSQKMMGQQDFLDKMEEDNDIAMHVFKSNLNTYKVSDSLIIKEGIPFNAAPLGKQERDKK